MKKIILFILPILTIFLITGCKKSSEVFKVGFVYVGSVTDGGWTQSNDEARIELEKEIPNIETSYVSDVPKGKNAERVINEYATQGYSLIFSTSFDFMNQTINVAKHFPKTVFMNCSGYKRAKNVGTYFGAVEEAQYLTGLIAGKMTKKNSVGFVAPYQIPEIIRVVNAYALGVKAVNPNAKVKVVWTNSWFDPAKEREAAILLMDSGIDVLATGCDSSAVVSAGESRGVWTIGYNLDSSSIAPKTYLTSPILNWIVVYKDIVEKVMSKKIDNWSNFDYYEGLNTGIVSLVPLSSHVPEDVKELVEKNRVAIANRELNIFTGPIYKNDGSIAIADGEVASYDDIMSMEYLVDNIIGILN